MANLPTSKSTQRLLLALLWMASVAAAYFSSPGTTHSKDRARNAAEKTPPNGGPQKRAQAAGEVARQFGEGGAPAKGSREELATLIRGAQEVLDRHFVYENELGMFGALAELAELDLAQIQMALEEVERSVESRAARLKFYSFFYAQWAEKDGPGALASLGEKVRPLDYLSNEPENIVLATWARREPLAALAWFLKERAAHPKEDRSPMLLFAGMATGNAKAAVAALGQMEEKSMFGALSGIGIGGGAGNAETRDRVVEAAATLPADQRKMIYEGMVSLWARNDAEGLMKWFRALEEGERVALCHKTAMALVFDEPLRALEIWRAGDEMQKYGAPKNMIEWWMQGDPKAAGEWLAKQAGGAELDGARTTYVWGILKRDPAGAMAWAEDLKNEENRAGMVAAVFLDWRKRDAKAAEAALRGSSLPVERIEKIFATPASEERK